MLKCASFVLFAKFYTQAIHHPQSVYNASSSKRILEAKGQVPIGFHIGAKLPDHLWEEGG